MSNFSLSMLLCVLIGVAPAFSAPSVRIARFAGDRSAAISYTFDDGLRDQYTLAVPMLNEVGFKGTFFIIPGRVSETIEDAERRKNDKRAWGTITWEELRQMAGQGHEIGSHTWTHPNLTKLLPEEVDAQFTQANAAIEKEVGQSPLTLAYPFNARSVEIETLAEKYYAVCRTFQKGVGGDRSTVENLNAWADEQVKNGAWGVVMVHAIANGYAAFTDPDIFADHLRYVKSREADVWVDTFAKVGCYVKERDAAALDVSGKTGRITCTLTTPLDPVRYTVPLTLIVDAPGVKTAGAKRKGQNLPVQIFKDTIQIQVVPGKDPILIAWK